MAYQLQHLVLIDSYSAGRVVELPMDGGTVRNRDQHVHMIRHQVPFFDPALSLLGRVEFPR